MRIEMNISGNVEQQNVEDVSICRFVNLILYV